jgi:esterase
VTTGQGATGVLAETAARSCFVEVNNLRLHYLDWGGSSPNNLVLLHGIGGNCHIWDDFAERWRHEFRIFALDQRGYGDSDHAKDGYPVTAFASDLYELSRALQITSFDLVGISLCARNALPFAAEHSDMLKHLILVDCGPEIGREAAKGTASRFGQRPIGFRNLEEAVEYYGELHPEWPRAHLEHHMTHSLRLNWAGKLVWKHDPELVWITLSAGKREVPFLWEQCARITCPTLVMRGAQSGVLPPDILARMLALLPRGTSVEVENAGHSIHVDQPERFEHAVLEFLRS